ncbi:hypothetical protein SNK03_007096 [Fusarium graminearum]
MDEEVKNIGMHSKSDHKPVEASASQTDPSSQSSICDELREPSIPPARFWVLCVGVFLGLFLSMIDTSIVATSLHSIGVDFEVLEDVNWVALAYTLAYLGCAIVFARISDIVGRRDAFIAAYIIFFVFSLACGFAQTLNQLIAFRALQGVGGSGLYALTMIMMPELSPDNLKQHMAAMVGLVITVSGVLGPVLGGILTHYASWRWVFWIKYYSLLLSKVYSTAVVNTLLNGFPYLLLIYAIPLRFQVVSGKSALISGVMLLPMLGASAIGSVVAGKINNTKNYTFESLLVGSCFMALGCGLLASLSHESEDAKLLGFMTFCGLGFGLTVASSTMLSMVEVPIRDYAPAQGILSQVRLLGGSLGIATLSALLNEKSSKYLASILTPYEQATIGSSNTPLSNEQWSAVRFTYADAFKVEMKVATAVAACSVISAFGAFRRKRLLVAEQRAAIVAQEATRRRDQAK